MYRHPTQLVAQEALQSQRLAHSLMKIVKKQLAHHHIFGFLLYYQYSQYSHLVLKDQKHYLSKSNLGYRL